MAKTISALIAAGGGLLGKYANIINDAEQVHKREPKTLSQITNQASFLHHNNAQSEVTPWIKNKVAQVISPIQWAIRL